MHSCDLTFRGLGADDEAVTEAHSLAARLERNGQVVGGYVLGRIGAGLRMTCTLPLLDALDPRHHSKYVRQSLADLEDRSGQPLLLSLDANPTGSAPTTSEIGDPARAPFLVLKTTCNSLVAPLWDPRADEHLPLYLVPITADERERVFFWTRSYQRLDGIWFGAPSLEVESYREMANAGSRLMTQGREKAALIEDALGLPTYTWILRHYGAPERDEDRACPGCGGSWQVSDQRVPLRCEPCRLASHQAFCTDEEDWLRFAG